MRGRIFEKSDEVDDANHPPTAIINEIAVKRLFTDQDPLGAEIRTRHGWAKIVGIVADSYQYGLDSDKTMQIYIPLRHLSNTPLTLVARTTADPASYVSSLRSMVLSLDSAQPIYRVATMEQWLSNSFAPRRFTGVAFGVIATWVMAPLVASLLYGVSPKNLATFVVVPTVLVLVALLACCIPAWRTTRINLVKSLRHD